LLKQREISSLRRAVDRSRRHRRRGAALVLLAAGALLLAAGALLLVACGRGGSPPPPAPLLLSGPNTDITVVIPPGWHQVIDSANPAMPEMVTPTTCMGGQEVACATGLSRIASFAAPNALVAEQTVQKGVYAGPGVIPGTTISRGPGKVGDRDGLRYRFTFSNPGALVTSEIAVAPSGPAAPNPQGNHEYSVVLVWVTNKPGAPTPDVIDQIVGSAKVTGPGAPAPGAPAPGAPAPGKPAPGPPARSGGGQPPTS
jgi:hypothetical protein